MQNKFSPLFLIITASVIQFVLSGCAYKLSSASYTLPGNVKIIQIPLFINNSAELGVETFFTNALKSEALRSKFVTLKNDVSSNGNRDIRTDDLGSGANKGSKDGVEAILKGYINEVSVVADESVIEAKNTKFLPMETVLAIRYSVRVTVELKLTRSHSSELLWSGIFTQTSNYSAPQITLPVINTSNALYNHSAKRQTIDALSKEMMQAAFDRMLESF